MSQVGNYDMRSFPMTPRLSVYSDTSSTRIPKCARCRNHGIDCELKGHKDKCEYKECTCRSCLMVVERQKITAARVAHLRQQRKLAGKRGLAGLNFQQCSPLTEEEDYILSRHLEKRETEHDLRRSPPQIEDPNRYVSMIHPDQWRRKSDSIISPIPIKRPYVYASPGAPRGQNNTEYKQQQHERRGPWSPQISTFRSMESASYDSDEKTRSIDNSRRDFQKNDARHYDRDQSPILKDTNDAKTDKNVSSLNIPTSVIDTVLHRGNQRKNGSPDGCRTSRKLVVLQVMFPELEDTHLQSALEKFDQNIQMAVEHLLKYKSSEYPYPGYAVCPPSCSCTASRQKIGGGQSMYRNQEEQTEKMKASYTPPRNSPDKRTLRSECTDRIWERRSTDDSENLSGNEDSSRLSEGSGPHSDIS